MSNILHACLYNTEADASDELQSQIKGLNFIRLVKEVATPDALAAILHECTINLIFFHLDPNPDAVVDVIDQVSTRYPALALIAISHLSGPDAILGPMRAGCDQFVCEPIDANDLATAVGRVASSRLLSNTKSRCICVTSASGGAGATSIACNLALEIGSVVERECALLDLDLQFGDVALNFDCEPRYNIFDLAESSGDLDRAILQSTMTSLPCKVSLLTRPELVEQQEAITPDLIHRVIELLTSTYENVVVDVPGHLDARTASAFGQADLILIVCQLIVPSIRNAKRFYEALKRMGVPEDRIQVVVNRGDGKSRLSEKDIEETVRKPVYSTVPNDYEFVARSIDFGKPIASLDQNNAVRSAIRKLARKIVTEASAATKEPVAEPRKGFLSRLLAK